MSQGLPPKDLGAAAKTVANQFEVICGTADISTRSAFQHKSADGFSIGRLQVDLCQIHFLLQVIIRELTSGEELVKDIEVVPRIQRQEANSESNARVRFFTQQNRLVRFPLKSL